jgi:hypothetical protein
VWKKERAYREILFRFYEGGEHRLRLREVAHRCGVSPGLVSHALKPLQRMGAIQMSSRWFEVLDALKILMFWCNVRRLWGDIVYRNRLSLPVGDIEGLVPAKAVFTAYTAFKHRFGYAPADYGEVIAYGEREWFTERFGEDQSTRHPNLIVLSVDEHLLRFSKTPLAQIYVDLWNLGTWYAREFLAKLEKHLEEHSARSERSWSFGTAS